MSAIMMVPWIPFAEGRGFENTSGLRVQIGNNDWEHIYSPEVATPNGMELDVVYDQTETKSWAVNTHFGFVLGPTRTGQGAHCGDIKRHGENIWTDGIGVIANSGSASRKFSQLERWRGTSPFLHLDPVSPTQQGSTSVPDVMNVHITVDASELTATFRDGDDYQDGALLWTRTTLLDSNALAGSPPRSVFALPARARVAFFVIGSAFQSPNNNGCTERVYSSAMAGTGLDIIKYRIRGL